MGAGAPAKVSKPEETNLAGVLQLIYHSDVSMNSDTDFQQVPKDCTMNDR